ncbi:ferrochelatase [Raphidocelis subcapitata]|uniref:Ferrochelatase n=1 Tax=Raphidocelis subcapitata TaxID=307507 RepID=A0A2V0PJI5_9CHLO|nr:ferrochelatase [Raphidocelis subcapitata]|eukprot:GBF99709.1 ferrochelatase [Raphidocelis subcapitata]
MLATGGHIAHGAHSSSLRGAEPCSSSPACELAGRRRWRRAAPAPAAAAAAPGSEWRRSGGGARRPRAAPCAPALSTGVSRSGAYNSSSDPPPGGAAAGAAAGPAAAPPVPTPGKVGVLLLNLGGPEKLEDVRPFLYNLFVDEDIIRLPPAVRFLQPLLASVIAALRAPKSAEGYAAIGGGSPLRRITDEQAAAIRESLRRKGLEDAEVYVAMRYWNPYTEEALEQVVRDGIEKLVILPLYPQFSISTSGSSLRLIEALFRGDPAFGALQHTVIPSWYQRPGYVRAMADLIETELDGFPSPEEARIFFSAHGVPQSYVVEAGDPYKEEMEECVALIMGELARRGRPNAHTLAYQSRVGPVEWLKPYTDDSIRELGAGGCRSLLAVPISFVSEHIETLEEIDMEYRELAEESGVRHWRRVPALNTDASFIDDLADAVLEALPHVGRFGGGRTAATISGGGLGPGLADAAVPVGDLEALLGAYDRERRTLPAPVGPWEWGFTKSAETWNGRIAMVAIIVILLLELTTGRSILALD